MSRNVVLFCLDSARRDVFKQVAERLTDRAETVFTQCRAASSWSAPSHASMFTGELPHQHGVHVHDKPFAKIPRDDTFLRAMPNHEALGISANVFASSSYGFDTWFDEFVEVSTGRRFTDGIDPNAFYVEYEGSGPRAFGAFICAALASDHPRQSIANGLTAALNVLSRDGPIPKLLDDGANTIARESKRLIRETNGPYFLFTNIGDTHMPHRPVLGYNTDYYDVPNDWSTDNREIWEVIGRVKEREQYLARFHDLYAASTEYVDRKLDRLIDALQRESDRETTFIITADHGENLGRMADENLLGHKSSLSEGVLHVPFLLVNPPEGYECREKKYFSHLDLTTLVPALARGETPDVFSERVSAEIIGMSPGPNPPQDYEYDYWDRAIRCVYEAEAKWVWNSLGSRKRVTIDHDRACWQSVAEEGAQIPEWAGEFFDANIEVYKQQAKQTDEEIDVGEVTQQRLEDLGYM